MAPIFSGVTTWPSAPSGGALPEPRPKLVAPDYAKLAAVRDELNDWWRRLLDGR